MGLVLIALVGVSAPAHAVGAVCAADDEASLLACASSARSRDFLSYDDDMARIALTADIRCGSNCCPSGVALLNLTGANQVVIDGQGHQILRQASQRQCSLATLHNARNVTLLNLTLDDDPAGASCAVSDQCPPMMHMNGASDVSLHGVAVRYSKGYAIYVQSVDGFAFTDSTLEHSGVLGLYIGHEDDATRRVRVQRSNFRDNATNALALLGVDGSANTTLITDNLFERNHAFGRWPVEPQYGTGMTGGGQIYIARAQGVRMQNNRIMDGSCANCFFQGALGTGVSGIEIGLPGRASAQQVQINDNVIENNHAWAIFSNVNSPIDASVQVFNNQLRSNGANLNLPGASIGQNTLLD